MEAPHYSSSTLVHTNDTPIPIGLGIGSYASSAKTYTNRTDRYDDSDSVAEVSDQDSIPDVFKAKKRVRSSHIWLPDSRIECVIDELIGRNAGGMRVSDF